MSRINVILDAPTLDLLKGLETATGASRSEIIRRAVARYAEDASFTIQRLLLEEKHRVQKNLTLKVAPKAAAKALKPKTR